MGGDSQEYQWTIDGKAAQLRKNASISIAMHSTDLLHCHIKVRFEFHCGFEPLTIFLDEVEVNCTHQLLVLIQHISLQRRNTKADKNRNKAGISINPLAE